ncbi:CbtA family protein [Hansschlegelia plantiphila]|uniref:Cobalt transporter subunit CbtA n=1 Tax=Hansschlegelia plantiphila TaxID=374655 RepID=A0A9W6J1E9_9HYPH|nr:CbtA family protein [Hansschlegelia plantiphila]GLK67613.1 cobalt transporter subunit CbtA [Hansschlegelia plantiphila]
MRKFRSILFICAFAALVVGGATGLLRVASTTPLILQAEVYEHAAGHAESAPAGHAHEAEEWEPADGWQRNGLTVLATMVATFGFALLLAAVSEFAGGIRNWRAGLLWGSAGFAVFVAAPSLGLPAELPGAPESPLLARQAWWLFAAAATAGGLALMVFPRRLLLAVIGMALLVAPHIVGAPAPTAGQALAPALLEHRFLVTTAIVSLIFWLALGAWLGLSRSWFRERLA